MSASTFIPAQPPERDPQTCPVTTELVLEGERRHIGLDGATP